MALSEFSTPATLDVEAMSPCDETDLAFYSRRAMEESRAAARTGSRRASSAHRHMAVAYAVRMRDEELSAAALAEMLALVDAADCAAEDDGSDG